MNLFGFEIFAVFFDGNNCFLFNFFVSYNYTRKCFNYSQNSNDKLPK